VAFTSENNFTDRQLINAVLGGNTQAFALVIKNTEGLIIQIVCRMINNIEDRKDVIQDVYLKAFNNLESFKLNAKLSTWIGQIAFNTCVNYLEKKKHVLPGELYDKDNYTENKLQEIDAEVILSKKALSTILTAEIEKLSTLHKTLIILYHHEEQSYADIAQITNLPEGTVKNYLFRARKKLKENILAKYKKEEL
jgi:RNA polymerase sigma factor (sigma-70 family)